MSTQTRVPVVWADGFHLLVACCHSGPAGSEGCVEVLVARWESSDESFALEARMKLPVAGMLISVEKINFTDMTQYRDKSSIQSLEFEIPNGWTSHRPDDAHLLAGGCVVDKENGLFQSYFVVQEEDAIIIGIIDSDVRNIDAVAYMPLPASDAAEDPAVVRDCWLTNGPTVLAIREGRLLVAAKRPVESLGDENKTEVESTWEWEAHTLDVSNIVCSRPVKLHFGGELTSEGRLDAILSVVNPVLQGSRLVEEWSYISVTDGAVGNGTQVPQIVEPHEDNDLTFSMMHSSHVPKEIDPDTISCILPVAAAPRPADVPRDILVGTTDRRLLRCRNGHVVQSTSLDGIPLKLYFAVVAGGQGVIVITLDGTEQNVIAICAESHQKLQGWKSVRQVVVGDFCQVGHDQIVLLNGSLDSLLAWELYAPLGQNGLDFTVVHGFSKFASSGTPQGSQSHLKQVEALDEHKVAGLETMEKALHQRLACGLAELKAAETEIEVKKELYRVSSRVMQGMVTRMALEDASSQADGTRGQEVRQIRDEQAGVKVVKAEGVENRICGTNWILIVNFSVVKERPTVTLHNVSIFATSVNGSVDCTSSVLKSLSASEGMGRIVLSIPLEKLSLLPGFPIQIFLTAERVSTSISATSEGPRDSDTHYRVFTQWLCRSHVIHPTAVKPLEAMEVSTILETVVWNCFDNESKSWTAYYGDNYCPQDLFLIDEPLELWDAQSKRSLDEQMKRSVIHVENLFGDQNEFLVEAEDPDSIRLLTERIQMELCLEGIRDDEEHKGHKFTFAKVTGIGFVEVAVNCVGNYAVVTLRTSRVQLLAMMQESLIQLFGRHQLRILPRICYPATLSRARALADALSEELKSTSIGGTGQHEDSSSTAARLDELQRTTDQKCAELLSGTT